MAINYNIQTDLELEDLKQRVEAHAKEVEGLWIVWRVTDDLGPFHEEVMEEYGIYRGFKTELWTRHSKDRSAEASEKQKELYHSLPGRKLLRMDDSFIDYQEN